jgi:hypothetical protein
MGDAAHQHEVECGIGKRRGRRLRDIGHASRDLGPDETRQRLTADANLAGLRAQETEQRLEECGLATAVGPEEA